MAVEDKLFS